MLFRNLLRASPMGQSRSKQVAVLTNLMSKDQKAYATEATFEPLRPFKLHRLETGPETPFTCNRDDALKFYKQMLMIRRLETAAGNLYKEKIVRGFCHLYSGQEAVAVGMRAAMQPQDTIVTAYRDHGWAYTVGLEPLKILAELTGRSSGCSRGKGGSMHMYAPGFYGGNGIVGAQCPIGAGIALAHKYKKDNGVCITLYGDGAANQGQLFEAYNIAKLWSLPVIFVCENNGYGMGTSVERSSASTNYYSRCEYIPGIWVDGMDILCVREATHFAMNHCRSGQGPIVIDAATYRYSGHSMSDPGTSYRTREEIQEVRQSRDPISSFKEKVLNSSLATGDEIKAIDSEVRAVVDEATKQSKTDPEIDVSEIYGDVYAKSLTETIRGVLPWDQHPHLRIGSAWNIK